jgi:hypothetical protein
LVRSATGERRSRQLEIGGDARSLYTGIVVRLAILRLRLRDADCSDKKDGGNQFHGRCPNQQFARKSKLVQ